MNFLGNKRSEKVSLGNGFSEKIQLYENIFQLSWVFYIVGDCKCHKEKLKRIIRMSRLSFT